MCLIKIRNGAKIWNSYGSDEVELDDRDVAAGLVILLTGQGYQIGR